MTDFNQNVEMVAGTDHVITITLVPATDISGLTIDWVLTKIDGTVVVTKQTGGQGVSITDGPNGVFTITLADTDTDGLRGEYRHEAMITDGSGNEDVVTKGRVLFRRRLNT